MECIYSFFIAFSIVFFSELGDKTQLLVLSFSTKNKTKNILLGVALGSFLSHGFAILFGSKIACFSSNAFQSYLKFFTYFSFILLGIIGFLPKKTKATKKNSILENFSFLKFNSSFMVAFCILIGELGDKTFLASLGLGLEYPNSKFSLILGSIFGMVTSNFIAIFCGKLLGNHLKLEFIETLSNILFIIFGLFGLLNQC